MRNRPVNTYSLLQRLDKNNQRKMLNTYFIMKNFEEDERRKGHIIVGAKIISGIVVCVVGYVFLNNMIFFLISGFGSLLTATCLVGALSKSLDNRKYLNQLELADINSIRIPLALFNSSIHAPTATIREAVQAMENCVAGFERDRKLMNDLRFSFLMGRVDPNSTVPEALPNEIAHKILYFGGLFANPPIDQDSVSKKLPRQTKIIPRRK